MPQKCSVYTHPKRAHINRAIVSHKASLRAIAGQYGVSHYALQRHKTHTTTAIQVAKKNGDIKQGKRAHDRLTEMIEDVTKKYEASTGMVWNTPCAIDDTSRNGHRSGYRRRIGHRRAVRIPVPGALPGGSVVPGVDTAPRPW